jgi:flagellar basal-body rod protein FlgG
VTLPAGNPAYTRDGSLYRTGRRADRDVRRHEVAPGITIPEDARQITINADGEVYASFLDRVEAELLGSSRWSGFSNDQGLEAVGSNLFVETAASGAPFTADPGTDGLGTLRQGHVETSSVDAVREITELIEAQRGYELNAKVITAADQMLGATTQVR